MQMNIKFFKIHYERQSPNYCESQSFSRFGTSSIQAVSLLQKLRMHAYSILNFSAFPIGICETSKRISPICAYTIKYISINFSINYGISCCSKAQPVFILYKIRMYISFFSEQHVAVSFWFHSGFMLRVPFRVQVEYVLMNHLELFQHLLMVECNPYLLIFFSRFEIT